MAHNARLSNAPCPTCGAMDDEDCWEGTFSPSASPSASCDIVHEARLSSNDICPVCGAPPNAECCSGKFYESASPGCDWEDSCDPDCGRGTPTLSDEADEE